MTRVGNRYSPLVGRCLCAECGMPIDVARNTSTTIAYLCDRCWAAAKSAEREAAYNEAASRLRGAFARLNDV